MCRRNGLCKTVFEPLGDWFTLKDLRKSIARVRATLGNTSSCIDRMLERIEWLAESNYDILFAESLPMSSRIIFPVSPHESNGIEDARSVRFQAEDGDVMYYATYAAYNGRTIRSQMIEARDFLHFRVITLSGCAVQNKGMCRMLFTAVGCWCTAGGWCCRMR